MLSCLIAENDRSKVHLVAGGVPRIPKETFMLLKSLNRMRFYILDILSGRQSLFSRQYVFHQSSSACSTLRHGKSSLKRSANKLYFSLQLKFL